MKTGLKWYPKLGIYKNSTGSLTYNPKTGMGYSYKWYEIAAKVKGYQYLNNYRYSVTTGAHVRAIRKLFAELNLRHIEETAPNGVISGLTA